MSELSLNLPSHEHKTKYRRNKNRGILYWARKADELETQKEIIERSKNEEISVLKEEFEEVKESFQEQISAKSSDALSVRMRLVKSIRENKRLMKALDKVTRDKLEADEEIRRLKDSIEELNADIALERARKNLETEDLRKKMLEMESQMKVPKEQKDEGCQTEKEEPLEVQMENLQKPTDVQTAEDSMDESVEEDKQVAKNSRTDRRIPIKIRRQETNDEPIEEEEEENEEPATTSDNRKRGAKSNLNVSISAKKTRKSTVETRTRSVGRDESASELDSETQKKINRVVKKLQIDTNHSKEKLPDKRRVSKRQ